MTKPISDEADEARESGVMELLDVAQCWRLLSGNDVGRLAMAVGGEVDIFPVNYVVDDTSVVFRTAPGTKLIEVVIGGPIAFEADGYDAAAGQAWSVVCKGTAQRIEDRAGLDSAEALGLVSWNNAPKEEFVRITPTQVTGRRYHVYRKGAEA
ncbi:pyridoxamine 5'-phosphate oxidase family protein [Skermania piniformis]|nr:pyridoxamine 5'-phosphate oxidase family protein [Skermania piniformis]